MAASAFEFVAKKRIFERSVFSVESQYSVGICCSYILFNSGCKHFRVSRSISLPYICKLTRDLANVQLVWDQQGLYRFEQVYCTMITSLTVNSFTVVIVHCSRNFNRSDILSHFPNYNEKTSLAKVLEDSAYYTDPLPLGFILL